MSRTVFVVRIAVVPVRMCADPDVLSHLRGDRESVSGALGTTVAVSTIPFSGVTDHEEVVLIPVCSVIVDKGGVQVCEEILDGDIEEAVCLVHWNLTL